MIAARDLFAVLIVFVVSIGIAPLAPNAGVLAQGLGGLGTPLAVTNDDGTTVGSVTVTEVIDPFTDFNPDYPPEAGSRFVVAIVAFDADAGQRFDIQPWTIVLQDDAGFLWNEASLVLPDDALIPELSSQTLSPGSRITGALGFVMPEDRVPARILYQPVSSRVMLVAELTNTPAPAAGDVVSIPDSLGGMGAVTVTSLNDPQEDLDPSQATPEGTRFVQVMLTYENTSDGLFVIEPYGLLLRDANGDLWYSSYVTRVPEQTIIPDLTGAQLAPGDRLSGAVSFAVPVGVDVTGLYLSPVSGQLLQLAEFGASEQAAVPALAPSAVAGNDMKPVVSISVALEDDDPCVALQSWLVATRERIARAGEMSVDDATLEDSAVLADHAVEYAALADAQLADPIPDAAVAVNKALVATLNAYSSAVQQILDADEPGKDTALEVTEGMNTFNAAGARISAIEHEMANLAATCGLP